MEMKKLLLIVVLIILLAALPVILLSNPVMEWYQELVDKNPSTDWAKWGQLKIADAYYMSMRYDAAAVAYKKFFDRFGNENNPQVPEDPRCKDVRYYYALSLDAAVHNQAALEAYQAYLDLYPDDARKAEIEKAMINIRYVRRH